LADLTSFDRDLDHFSFESRLNGELLSLRDDYVSSQHTPAAPIARTSVENSDPKTVPLTFLSGGDLSALPLGSPLRVSLIGALNRNLAKIRLRGKGDCVSPSAVDFVSP
jgi:hypothetical protein